MKKYLVVVLLLAGIIYACNQPTPGDTDVAIDPFVDSVNRFCPDTSMPNELCSMLPWEIDEKFQFGYSSTLSPTIQPQFDVFSWQSFVALNWPADVNGKPLGGKIGDHPNAPRVWESYKDLTEIFDDNAPLLLKMKSAEQSNFKFFYRTSKSPHRLDSMGSFLDADGQPLIDRNLNFVVFEVKANPVEADFIKVNNLVTKKGIDSISTPISNNPTARQIAMPSSSAASKNVGAMEIKTAWRILDSSKGDDYSKYYTRDAIISISAENSTSNTAFTIKTKVGLVGMHIVRKTGLFANWIWSTFEHIDNTPDNLQQAQMDQKRTTPWSFYYPESLGLQPNDEYDTIAGDGGNYRFDSTWPYAKRYARTVGGEKGIYGTQVQRMYPIYYRTEQVNELWRRKLAGTVWANYKLVGSQWATSTLTPGKPLPAAPSMMGNSTLETYILGYSSCVSCHMGASINYNGNSVLTDLSYLLALHAK
jgi:hypothetical protein